jgi:hypothetical protein
VRCFIVQAQLYETFLNPPNYLTLFNKKAPMLFSTGANTIKIKTKHRVNELLFFFIAKDEIEFIRHFDKVLGFVIFVHDYVVFNLIQLNKRPDMRRCRLVNMWIGGKRGASNIVMKKKFLTP